MTTTISGAPGGAATTFDGTEEFPVDQAGTTKHATTAQMKAFAIAGLASGSGGAGGGAYVLIQDVESSGTGGGAATPNAWNTRTLNTVTHDDTAAVTLSGNQFTLPVGTYRIRASAPAAVSNNHKLRLTNVSDGTYLYGSSEWNQASVPYAMTQASVVGAFTLTAPKTFKLEHFISVNGNGSQTLGISTNDGSNEIYSQIEIWVIA